MSHSFPTRRSSDLDSVAHAAVDFIDNPSIEYKITLDNRVSGPDINIVNNSDYTSSLSFDAQAAGVPDANRYGSFQIIEVDKRNYNESRNAIAYLRPNTITIAPLNAVAVVPEPASWAMMIAGFGIVGGAMRKTNRRRRSNVRVTFA